LIQHDGAGAHASAVVGMMIKPAYNKGRIIDQFLPALSLAAVKSFSTPLQPVDTNKVG
jgi:hypothetical protein